MADETHRVEIDYVYGADVSQLQKARDEQAKLNKTMAETATSAKDVGAKTADAAKKFYNLSNAEKYVNSVKIASLNLRGALSSVNKTLAEAVGHVAGMADAGADAAQGITNYGKATSGAEKFAAGLSVATNVLSLALEATAIAIQKIDKAADDYVKGAQQRFFHGAEVAATQHRQLNEIIEAGWDKFDKAKTFAENYANALKWVQEQGGLAAAAAENWNTKLTELGVKTEADVALKAQEIGDALAYMKESMGLSEEEATKKLAPALKGLQDDLGGLADKEVPNTATALIELGKQYDVMGDKAKDAGNKATSAIEDQIKAIRDGLSPAMQEQLDVMTKLRGQTEEAALAQAENLKWTQDTALQTIKAKLAAGDYIEATDYMAAGVSDLSENSKEMADVLAVAREEIEKEAEAAEKAATSKTRLADAEESVGEATSEMTEGVRESTGSLEGNERETGEWIGEPPSGPPMTGGEEYWPMSGRPRTLGEEGGIDLGGPLAQELAEKLRAVGVKATVDGVSKTFGAGGGGASNKERQRAAILAQVARRPQKTPGVSSGAPDPRLMALTGVSSSVAWDPSGPAMSSATSGAMEGGWSPGLEAYGTGYGQGQGGGGQWAGSGIGGEGVPMLGEGVSGPGITPSEAAGTLQAQYAGPGTMSDPAVQSFLLESRANRRLQMQLDGALGRIIEVFGGGRL